MKEQCSATATALALACEPRGCTCDQHSIRLLLISNLELESNATELAAGYLVKDPFLDVPQSSLIVDGLSKVGWSQGAVVHYGFRCVSPATAPHPPLASSPEAKHKHLKAWVLE